VSKIIVFVMFPVVVFPSASLNWAYIVFVPSFSDSVRHVVFNIIRNPRFVVSLENLTCMGSVSSLPVMFVSRTTPVFVYTAQVFILKLPVGAVLSC